MIQKVLNNRDGLHNRITRKIRLLLVIITTSGVKGKVHSPGSVQNQVLVNDLFT
jgi:hypothetical protein